ncbi:lipoyl(octanoyl) transferase LipB [Aquirufa ecclesiirivi]|uniref:lipoyl(octanoyl) transferase LipB n=1 Tax=Aquirufa ecclesiirivi TaxID=2715124 RepID=UPI00140C42D0|nr:lipoyl(octanoyl) transferase LipB [Aquirufa ecclesiirivi]NHC47932.1 lipoyl(octanoyl) transferase LipB [Aquirufa ecclesiirivi]
MPNKEVQFVDIGLAPYQETWDLQEALLNHIAQIKLRNRREGLVEESPNFLLFCEHPHVYTLGKSGDESHLLMQEPFLASIGASFYRINRGGDITYHGPGQLVGYPILDLENFYTDIHLYLRMLEEAITLTCQEYGLTAGRIEGLTGVWIDPESNNARKICALGVKASRWISMHGFAFNVNTDLSYFSHIVPCGIATRGVSSLQQELGREMDIQEVKSAVLAHLSQLFEWNLHHVSRETLNLTLNQ